MLYYNYSNSQIEEMANKLNERYDASRLTHPSRIDVYDIVDLLGARLAFEYLSPDRTYLGATIFQDGMLYVWPGNPYYDGMMPTKKLFYGGTIIIDRDLNESTKEVDEFTENFTVLHECFHFEHHQACFKHSGHMSRSFSGYGEKQRDKTSAFYWIEHQANYGAACFLMPREAVIAGAKKVLNYHGSRFAFASGINDEIKELGRMFGVNYSPMLYRLQELGIVDSRLVYQL